ncbi:uncharacterized protein LOC136037217 isoform X2 [Artemia franciscana]|uniref:Uncharacterized protein n=1 Tax=Artemia franciscana TaxID=6661 RepID=A0AA88I2C4_ARTSF|nr:hypothetical protein QYM36_005310 [Artemia franciscana]
MASYKGDKPSYFLLNGMEKPSKQPESPADDVFPFSFDENVQAPEISFDLGPLIEKVQKELKKKFPHDLASTEMKNCKRGLEEQNEKQVSKEKKKRKLESEQVMPFDNLVFDLSAYEDMNDLKPPRKSEENKLRKHHSGFYRQISSATANRVH